MRLLPGPRPQDGQRLGGCSDFGHPFPDKHTNKNTLSPEARAKQPETYPSIWWREGQYLRLNIGAPE